MFDKDKAREKFLIEYPLKIKERKERVKITITSTESLTKTQIHTQGHYWIRRNGGQKIRCDICKTPAVFFDGMNSLDWANKDHKYRKIREDWMTLCRTCHVEYDKQNNSRRKLGYTTIAG